jgi:hypothetical protein
MNPEAYVEMATIESTHWWFCARRKILERIIETMVLPGDARILEVGWELAEIDTTTCPLPTLTCAASFSTTRLSSTLARGAAAVTPIDNAMHTSGLDNRR